MLEQANVESVLNLFISTLIFNQFGSKASLVPNEVEAKSAGSLHRTAERLAGALQEARGSVPVVSEGLLGVVSGPRLPPQAAGPQRFVAVPCGDSDVELSGAWHGWRWAAWHLRAW